MWAGDVMVGGHLEDTGHESTEFLILQEEVGSAEMLLAFLVGGFDLFQRLTWKAVLKGKEVQEG